MIDPRHHVHLADLPVPQTLAKMLLLQRSLPTQAGWFTHWLIHSTNVYWALTMGHVLSITPSLQLYWTRTCTELWVMLISLDYCSMKTEILSDLFVILLLALDTVPSTEYAFVQQIFIEWMYKWMNQTFKSLIHTLNFQMHPAVYLLCVIDVSISRALKFNRILIY
jgi:hypothetical protein